MKLTEVMAVSLMISIVPLCAMKPAVKQKALHKFENKTYEPKLEWEFLVYPEDAEIKLDAKLEKEYQRVGNEFRVPKGTDARLIHPTLVPERFDDFAVGHVADAFY